MSKRRQYIIMAVLVLLLVILCAIITMCNGEKSDNETNKIEENQTEIILDSNKDEEVSIGEKDTNDVNGTNHMIDLDNTNSETIEQQNQTLNSNNTSSKENSYDFDEVWSEGSGTNNNSDNTGNSGNEEDFIDSKEEDNLNDETEDNQNNGYGPFVPGHRLN